MMREKTSLPLMSVPSQCVLLGGSRIALGSARSGGNGASKPGANAISTVSSTIAMPAIRSGRPRMACLSLELRARVDRMVDEVDDEVEREVEERSHKDEAL